MGDEQPPQLARMLSDMGAADAFFHRTHGFIVADLGDVVRDELHIERGRDGRLWHYDEGVYRPDGDDAIRERVRQILGERWRKRHGDEVVAWLHTWPVAISERPPEHLFNVTNGLLDWRTGVLIEHTPDVLHTIRVPHAWKPGAQCPTIERYLTDVFTVDRDAADVEQLDVEAMVAFAYELLGYVLLPVNPYRKAVLLLGPGGNGKSVFLALAQALVGEANCSAQSLQKLAEDRFAAAELHGMLANICGDLDARAIARTDLFKSVTGGDRISAERKYGQPFTFLPFALLMFSANEAPFVSDQSQAWFDRWVVIPFRRRFEGTDACDPTLLSKVTTRAELEGLLVRAVEGLRQLMQRGHFDLPAQVVTAADDYRERLDTVRSFFTDECVLDEKAWSPRSSLYSQYQIWAASSGHRFPLAAATFYDRLRQDYSGRIVDRTRHGVRGFAGVRFREPRDSTPDREQELLW